MTEPLQLTDIGITPRKAAQFASKGIETVQDLLMFSRPSISISGILSILRKEKTTQESMLR